MAVSELIDVALATFTSPVFLLGVVLCVTATLNQNIGMGCQKIVHLRLARTEPKRQYFQDVYWWAAFALFLSGVVLDFVALGFLPASVALPLGGIGLVASGYFSHVKLGEAFTKLDKVGTVFIMVGSWTTVVFSAKDDLLYTAAQLWHKFSSMHDPAFWYLAFCVLTVVGLAEAMRSGHSNAIIASVLPGAIGAFGNLGGKSSAELVRLTLSGESQLGHPFSYVFVGGTVLTLVVQNHFLQMAIAKFDNIIVVPIYFVTLVVYSVFSGIFFFQEFGSATVLQDLVFLLGIVGVIGGTYLLTKDHLHSSQGVKLDEPSDDKGWKHV
ncbi:Magnesium transporter NIPA [Carpediemonas membranifera]|uniref:Magnesium transporter NIPA n=1 Tax=Carpediemonas membranifera TaxID=201153 RepID=A0A8J6E394_9EUKA|nr:Magnesium transporter NIPA [Carpediemonas membranifera]|eukprot:KAG9392842.1 Magnesium transporter NIPA [Carpediemonas membranifera]